MQWPGRLLQLSLAWLAGSRCASGLKTHLLDNSSAKSADDLQAAGLTSADCGSFSQAFVLEPAPTCEFANFSGDWVGCSCEVPLPPKLRLADVGASALPGAKEPEPMEIGCPFASCKGAAAGEEAKCLRLEHFGFSKVEVADLGAEGSFRQVQGCSYLMGPGRAFTMPDVVKSFRFVLDSQKEAMGYDCGGSLGLRPSNTMLDVCRHAMFRLEVPCVHQKQVSCDSTWTSMLPAGCESAEPPYGFTGSSTVKELCPLECDPSDVSALAQAVVGRRERKAQEEEAERQRAREAVRRQAQEEARKKDEAAAQVEAHARAKLQETLAGSPAAAAAQALAGAPGAAEALASPAAASALGNPDFAQALAANPGLLGALSQDPSSLPAVKAMAANPTLLAAVKDNPALAVALAADPAKMKAVAENPALAKALAADPTLAAALLADPAKMAAVAKNPALASAMAADPALAAALLADPAKMAAVAENPALAKALAADPALAAAAAAHPGALQELGAAISQGGSAAEVLQKNPALKAAVQAAGQAQAAEAAAKALPAAPQGQPFPMPSAQGAVANAPAAAAAASPFAAPIELVPRQEIPASAASGSSEAALNAKVGDLEATVRRLQRQLQEAQGLPAGYAPAPAPAPASWFIR